MSDVQREPGDLFVGVQNNPDGTRNFSKAMRMERPTETVERERQETLDRLKGRLVVDSRREARYQKFIDEVSEIQREGKLATWFATQLNSLTRPDGVPIQITAEDLQGIEFIVESPQAAALSTTFGIDVKRPFFRVNLWVFRDVYKKFTGHTSSNGCVITGGGLNDQSLTRDLPIIFAPQLGPEITHEILHTIDPYFGKRAKDEAILEEFATFYRETYVPRIYIQTLTTGDGSGRRSEPTVSSREVFETMPRLRQTLKQDSYRNNYGKAFPTQELYDRKVDVIAETLMKLEQYLSKVEINKAILNAKSHGELLALLDDCQQQKLTV